MASRVSSRGEVSEPPEIGASRFYSKKRPTVPAKAKQKQNEQTMKPSLELEPKPRPRGIIQALSLDRAGISSRPHHYRETYLKEHLGGCDSMYSTDIVGHHGCVNALAFSKGEEQFLGTGELGVLCVQSLICAELGVWHVRRAGSVMCVQS